MKGENRTTLAILTIAVVSLIVGVIFAPQIGAEAKAEATPEYALEDVSSWLLRLAAWVPPEAPSEPADSHPEAIQSIDYCEFL